MKKTAILISLLLAAPAPAQDAQPAPSTEPAADVLAKLLKTASEKKVLQHRLLTKRYYLGSERGREFLVTGEGTQTAKSLTFKLTARIFARAQSVSITYTFDDRFKLQSAVIREERPGRDKEELRMTIAGGKATAQGFRSGQPRGRVREAPWTGDRITLFSAWVLYSSLGDLGLQPEARVQTVREDDDIGKGRDPVQMLVRRQAAAKDGQTVLIDRERRGRTRLIAKVILGVGKDQGVVKRFVIDPKPDGRSDLDLKLISDKQAQEMLKNAPLLGNEGQAAAALRTIRYGQQNHHGKQKEYAQTIDELVASRSLWDKKLAEGKSPGYMLMIRRSPDKQSWMAIAVPEEPGKTGRYYYVTNQDGKTYRSKQAIELKDDCAIPPNLEQVGR